MTGSAPNNDRAASADDEHRDKRRKMDTQLCFPFSSPSPSACGRSLHVQQETTNASVPQETHATEGEPASQELQVLRPFSKTPAELRLMIAEQVVLQHFDSIIVKSSKGERIGDIWNRVYHLNAASNDLTPSQRGTWVHTKTISEPIFLPANDILGANYRFSPQVPALLQVNHCLHEEAREAYIKLAKARLDEAEAQQDIISEMFQDRQRHYGLSCLLNGLEKEMGVVITHSDADLAHFWKLMHRDAVLMVKHTLWWHVLAQTCKMLGQ